MKTAVNILWFRQDLRLSDNPALLAAIAGNATILPIYILDDENAQKWGMGGASRWWLHKSLEALNVSLSGNLCFFKGKAEDIISKLVHEKNVTGVYWNRCYEPWRIKRDKRIKASLMKQNILVKSYNGSLLFEPPNIKKDDGTPYKVFTPFYKKGCLVNGLPPREPQETPDRINFDSTLKKIPLSELELMPEINWYKDMQDEWVPGEQAAKEQLKKFSQVGIKEYKVGRNRPDKEFVSKLSPYLHFGELSPNQAWHCIKNLNDTQSYQSSIEHFLSELGWREFSNNLLYYWNELPENNLQKKFDRFPWLNDANTLKKWQHGLTGYPIIDAGMRQLWKTGYMHNRVRMVTGSFLVKNLMLDWRHGEQWFWDTLLDADLANNSASWQWIAGCGADAAPYFRIFNPILQGEKFDPDGVYVRKYVPELKNLSSRYIHKPWEAPTKILSEAKIVLGDNYPRPMVDIKKSRDRALMAFKALSG